MRKLILPLVTILVLAMFVASQSGVGGGGQSNVGGGGGLPSGFSPGGGGNQILGPNGSAASPSYAFANGTGVGMFFEPSGSGFNGLSAVAFSGNGGSESFDANTTGIRMVGASPVFFLAVSATTGMSAPAADVFAFGNGTFGDTTGTLKSASVMSVGTTFAASGCANSTLVGGATAGKYTSVTAGACTVTITMGNSSTAPNGWACDAHDVTTVADANNVTLGSSTTTTANLVEGTVVANDVIVFKCAGY